MHACVPVRLAGATSSSTREREPMPGAHASGLPPVLPAGMSGVPAQVPKLPPEPSTTTHGNANSPACMRPGGAGVASGPGMPAAKPPKLPSLRPNAVLALAGLLAAAAGLPAADKGEPSACTARCARGGDPGAPARPTRAAAPCSAGTCAACMQRSAAAECEPAITASGPIGDGSIGEHATDEMAAAAAVGAQGRGVGAGRTLTGATPTGGCATSGAAERAECRGLGDDAVAAGGREGVALRGVPPGWACACGCCWVPSVSPLTVDVASVAT
eukprot:365811-Chlamydomonas_euryale.AAC.19